MSAIGRFHYARNCQTHFNSCTSLIRVVVSSTVRNCTHQNSFFFRKELVDEFINFLFILALNCVMFTEQKMKSSIKDFFSKCDQIRRKLLLKSLLKIFIFCAVVLSFMPYFFLKWGVSNKMQ